MAIAVVPDIVEDGRLDADRLEVPWPRPVLRLVEPFADDPGRREAPSPPPQGLPAVRSGTEVSLRRHRRAHHQVRRRRAAALLVAASALGLLALPVSGLAGRPLDAHPLAGAVPAGSVSYVVRPGDTLWAIATRFGHGGDPRALVAELAAETGSEVVHPGERLLVP